MFVIHAYQVLDALYLQATWLAKSDDLSVPSAGPVYRATIPVSRETKTVADLLALVAEELMNQAQSALDVAL